MDYLQFMLLGLGAGAIYCGLALGIVLAYQGSGVINFAHGALAMYVTYVFDELRDRGDYVLPIVGLPDRIDLGDSLGLWPSLALSLATAAVLGLAVHALVFSPLRHAPLLAKVVAAVGIMLTLQGVVFLRFGVENRTVAAVLPNERVTLPFVDVVMPRDRLWLALIAVVVTLALWSLYRFTRFGLATKAAAGEEKGAILLGYSPQGLAAANWVLATMVAGMFGILAAPVSGLNNTNFVLFVVPALACALLGGLRSFPLAAVAALTLGMFESVISKISTWSAYPDWLPFQAAQKGLPFVVIIAFLVIGGRSLPERGSLDTGRQALAVRPGNVVRSTLIFFPAGLVVMVLSSGTLRLSLFVSLASAIILLSVVILTGFVGQVSLAQAVFAGAAGFATGKLAENGVPFPISPLLGALVATAVGLLMALPAVRIRGAQLAVVTMAAGVAIEEFVFKNTSFTGASAAQSVPPPGLFGIDLAPNRSPDFNRWEFGVLLLVVVTVLALMVTNLRRGATGRRFLALRSNERAAAAGGIDLTRTKLLAFGLSSFVAGLGGAMLAYVQGSISAISFSVFVSLTLLAFAYLGGIASVSGAIVGAMLIPGGFVFALADRFLLGDGVDRYGTLVGGLALVGTAIANPEGIVGQTLSSIRSRRPVHVGADTR